MYPTVSIIMNCLNSSLHLHEALDSIKAQTCQDFEIVFWDNCSSDDSPTIAKAFGSRLRYFRGSHTVPLGAARNLAIAKARGRYIAFLDCDDLWLPRKLETQIALFETNSAVGLTSTDTEIFDGRRILKRLFSEAKPVRGHVFRELLQRQWISMSSAMIRREALDSLSTDEKWFDESLNVCEEADVFYRIAHDWELDHVDEALTRWRVHSTNTTFRKFGQFADETLKILEKHRSLYADYDVINADLVELLTRRAAFQKAVALWSEGQNKAARESIHPWRNTSIKYRLFWLASFLPGNCFDFAARLYFALPAALRH